MMDFSAIMKFKGAWDTFTRNHPKFMPFMQAVGSEAMMDGTIIEVKVTSPEVKNPKYVRYGWEPFCTGNLVNEDGLPASTFRNEGDVF